MWIVKELEFAHTALSNPTRIHDIVCWGDPGTVMCINATFMDLDTQDERKFSVGTSLEMPKFLKAHRVYGVGQFCAPGWARSVRVFTVISELSLRFLECVESVEKLVILPTDELYEQLSKPEWWADDFRAADEDMFMFTSIVKAIDQEVPCTLFEALCYSDAGWVGDEYYLHESTVRSLDSAASVFRVRFKDINRARSLIAKAVLFNVNPLRAKADEEDARVDSFWKRLSGQP